MKKRVILNGRRMAGHSNRKNGVVYDYSGLYQVSNYGSVRSLNYRGAGKIKVLKPGKSNKGYLRMPLCKDGKTTKFSVHRLVATAFIPNPDNLPVVNHRDEDPSNCHVDNLEWCTVKYNTNYGTAMQRASKAKKGKQFSEEHKRKLSEAKKGSKHPKAKKVRCVENKQVFDTVKDATEWAGITGGISACLKGKIKTAGGYHWEYVDEK